MNILAFGIGNLGGSDLFIILLIVLVLFGAKKLPDLARSLGQSMNEFRKAREDIDREFHNAGGLNRLPATLPVHAASHSGAELPACDADGADPVGDVRRKGNKTPPAVLARRRVGIRLLDAGRVIFRDCRSSNPMLNREI